MVKRTLFFGSACRLSLKNSQLVIENKDTGEIKTCPVEDIGYVIIEDQSVSITIPALNALSANNAGVVFCDSRCMPSSMLFNLDSNNVLAEVYKTQIDASAALKKNLWKQIVVAKIENQSRLLNEIGKDGDVLKPYYMNVKSGDSDNREGVAARLYWRALFGDDFVRSRDGDSPNALLNYGYSILRAAMARAIMGSGLFPAFGLFHKNRYNAFPLADDLMEPYRPYVDQIVYQLYIAGKGKVDINAKQELLRLLFKDANFSNVTRPMEIALSVTTASLVKCLRGDAKQILFPAL